MCQNKNAVKCVGSEAVLWQFDVCWDEVILCGIGDVGSTTVLEAVPGCWC